MWKSVEWMTGGTGGWELAAFSAGALTFQWLARQGSNKEGADLTELEPLKHENQTKVVKEGLELPVSFPNAFERCQSYRLELSSSELSPTETESMTPSEDNQSCASSEISLVSLSIPE